MARIDTSPAPLMTPAQIITFDRVFCAALDSGMDWYSAMQKAHNAAGYSVITRLKASALCRFSVDDNAYTEEADE